MRCLLLPCPPTGHLPIGISGGSLAIMQLALCHILHSLLEISRCTALLQDIISYNLLKVPFFRDPSESGFLALEHGCGFVFRCWPACTYDIPGLQRLNRTQIVSPMINNKGGMLS